MPRFADPPKPWRGGEALRNARTCYDHLAGRLGVALADAMIRHGHVDASASTITSAGSRFLAEQAIALPQRQRPPSKRPACRACQDWSERRPHLAGSLGAALAGHAFAQGWVTRIPGGRALALTNTGRAGFARTFGMAP